MNMWKDATSWSLVVTETSHKFASVTVPDMAYSVEELLARHRSGLLTDDGGREPVWSEDADVDDPDMEKLMQADLVEKHEFAEAGREALREMRSKSEKEAASKAASEREAAIAAEVERRLKAPVAPPGPVPGGA